MNALKTTRSNPNQDPFNSSLAFASSSLALTCSNLYIYMYVIAICMMIWLWYYIRMWSTSVKSSNFIHPTTILKWFNMYMTYYDYGILWSCIIPLLIPHFRWYLLKLLQDVSSNLARGFGLSDDFRQLRGGQSIPNEAWKTAQLFQVKLWSWRTSKSLAFVYCKWSNPGALSYNWKLQ